MAELATLARPYANAVFDIAKTGGELDGWSRMLTVLRVASTDERLRVLLDAPDVEEVQKAYRLIEVCGDELNDRAKKFVNVLALNKRLGLLAEIEAQFEVRRAEEQRTLDVDVTSAFELTAEQMQKLGTALEKRFGRDINLSGRVDRSLIGGALIRAGDTVIDGTVRGRLDKLAESIQRS